MTSYVQYMSSPSDGHWCGLDGPDHGPERAGLRFHGPGPDREIHGLGGLVRGLKSLGPHRSVTGFHGSRSGFGGSWV